MQNNRAFFGTDVLSKTVLFKSYFLRNIRQVELLDRNHAGMLLQQVQCGMLSNWRPKAAIVRAKPQRALKSREISRENTGIFAHMWHQRSLLRVNQTISLAIDII